MPCGRMWVARSCSNGPGDEAVLRGCGNVVPRCGSEAWCQGVVRKRGVAVVPDRGRRNSFAGLARVESSPLPTILRFFRRHAMIQQTMPHSVRQSSAPVRDNRHTPQRLPDMVCFSIDVQAFGSSQGLVLYLHVIPAKAGIHVWTRPDVKDVLKAKRSNAVMYPASAKLPCPDGIRAPGPHHLIGLNGLGSPQVFQELVRPVLPSVHHRILVGEFMFPKIPCV